MGVGVQREGRIGVAQDAGQRLGVHTAGEGMGGEGMPLRYNYDKPENIDDGIGRRYLAGEIQMCINVACCADVTVTQPLLNLLQAHAIGIEQTGTTMPLRYNYDKPEKPRISRVFGYLARFFILFQTEKSSREVVIS